MENNPKKSSISHEEQFGTVMDVFDAVSDLDALPEENDGYCQSVTSGADVEEDYPTLVEIVFPKKCWELHGWSRIVVPVGEVLRWTASEDPLYGPDFEAIRSDFYPENSDAYDCWDLEPDINWRPDDKRIAEIRAELEAKAELRRRQDM